MSQPPPTPGSSPSRGSGADMARGMSEASRGLSVAFGFVFVVLVFWLAGRWIDDQLGTDPWLQIAGALIGWVLGVVTVVYMAKSQQLRGQGPTTQWSGTRSYGAADKWDEEE